jgi:hypothetical protein
MSGYNLALRLRHGPSPVPGGPRGWEVAGKAQDEAQLTGDPTSTRRFGADGIDHCLQQKPLSMR